MHEIFVKNENDFDHQDRFDGQDYFFPKGERVTIPTLAAEHMLGLGRQDKTDNLVRLGWANEGDAGVKKLANFVFTQGVMVEAPVDAQAALPLEGPLTTIKGEQRPA